MGLVTNLGAFIVLALASSRADAQTLTTLLSFSGTNGANPDGGFVLNGSTLYAMTEQGGSGGDGTIFSINTEGTGFQGLCTFNKGNGMHPFGSLTLCGSTLYGTTSSGGAHIYYGTVFSIPVSGGTTTPPTLL